MIRNIALGLSAALLLASAAAPVAAAPCRDGKGKFVKCVAKAPVVRCKDAKGKFAKCGSAGARPA